MIFFLSQNVLIYLAFLAFEMRVEEIQNIPKNKSDVNATPKNYSNASSLRLFIEKRQAVITSLTTTNTVLSSAKPGKLECYICDATFKVDSDLDDSCFINASSGNLITCTDKSKFCQVQRVELNRVISKISRSCTDTCKFGCALNGYGVTYKTCTSCCNISGCNVDNASTPGYRVGKPNYLSPRHILVLILAFDVYFLCDIVNLLCPLLKLFDCGESHCK
ncbi:unnamed protein product [Gordionus sp. m RMFG-2023]